jgi:hypothetical protein
VTTTVKILKYSEKIKFRFSKDLDFIREVHDSYSKKEGEAPNTEKACKD